MGKLLIGILLAVLGVFLIANGWLWIAGGVAALVAAFKAKGS